MHPVIIIAYNLMAHTQTIVVGVWCSEECESLSQCHQLSVHLYQLIPITLVEWQTSLSDELQQILYSVTINY